MGGIYKYPGVGWRRATGLLIAFALFCLARCAHAAGGGLIWAEQLNGTSSDRAHSMVLDSGSNIYITGDFLGTADFDPGPGTASMTSAGSRDILVLKLDHSGNFMWAKHMGGTGQDQGSGVALDSDGNVYTAGSFYGIADFDPGPGTANLTTLGGPTIFVSKLDNSGNYVWAKPMGGGGGARGYAVAVDSSGNVYTTGQFRQTADFDPGPGTANLTSAGFTDVFVSKLDSSGNYVWSKQMGGTVGESGYSLAVDSGGNVYITGYFQGTADFDPGAGTVSLTTAGGLEDVFVSKLDSSGSLVWAGRMGGTYTAHGYSLAVDSSDNIYITGYFKETADFDPGAGTAHLTSAGGTDVFVSKLDSAGNFVWAVQMGGAGDDYSYSSAVDVDGNVYTSGNFSDTADFDPGAGTANLTSIGSADAFLSKLDGLGNFVWVKQMGGTSTDSAANVAVNSENYVYTAGKFSGTADLDPGPGITNLTAAGVDEVFIAKFFGLDLTEPSVPVNPWLVAASLLAVMAWWMAWRTNGWHIVKR